MNQLAPTYLCDLIKPYKEVQRRDDLRSTMQHLLHTPWSGSVSFDDQSFRVAGATAGNALHLYIKQANSTDTFKSRLKTHFSGNILEKCVNECDEWC